MEMNGRTCDRTFAPRERVWAALNDAEVLRRSIDGCESLEKTSETSFAAKVVARIGPVKAAFAGKITLSDIDPPNGYTISGEGDGGGVGMAKGGASVNLIDEGGATSACTATVTAEVSGKLAPRSKRPPDRRRGPQDGGRFFSAVSPPSSPKEEHRNWPARRGPRPPSASRRPEEAGPRPVRHRNRSAMGRDHGPPDGRLRLGRLHPRPRRAPIAQPAWSAAVSTKGSGDGSDGDAAEIPNRQVVPTS